MGKILEDFKTAWNTLDADLIIKHLDVSFVYDSQWVYSSLDRDGYAEYIKAKFERIKETGSVVLADIVYDDMTEGEMLRLSQNGEPIYYRIKVIDNKVVKGDLCQF